MTQEPTQNVSTTELYEVYAAVLGAMVVRGAPSPLAPRVQMEAQLSGCLAAARPAELRRHLDAASIGDRLVARLRDEIAAWDAAVVGDWTADSPPTTRERRRHIYDLLQLDDATRASFDRQFLVVNNEDAVVAVAFTPWYPRVMAERESFYWRDYATYLGANGWSSPAISALGRSTSRVVERLGDPEKIAPYQAKGLVVGYVQSGKTANFTGVVAKAIDAGYRLVIVLTGTTDLLRRQTQRRIDKELVGVENLMRGIDLDDEEVLAEQDYVYALDWDDFIRHGRIPSETPEIRRLTTLEWDYRSLQQGISSLDFTKRDPDRPLTDPVNLHPEAARIAVVKKNPWVLRKLVRDLRRITTRLSDIPVLIIDDESDQASINTTNPAKWANDPERTAVNRLISQLLSLLKRGQYVGYTATPFANVFVDPSDSEDIFPRDFVISLDRAAGYMGATDFHDLDGTPEDEPQTVVNSNEKAYVRPVYEADADASLREAIDMFVLTGAIKKFRESRGAPPFRHHTMLAHQSVRQAAHRELADRIRVHWRTTGYGGANGIRRLEQLYENDVRPVLEARQDGEIPDSFAEVRAFVGDVVALIGGSTNDPVLIVNGDEDMKSEEVDFEHRPVWRILVGGTKLARGFTVEGLTVSYYLRVTRQADALMQMGRWFGFRGGYRDLVRLYISRAKPGSRGFDLYKSFEAACRSEELFRAELRRYARMRDGLPLLTPAQVPPLVAQYVRGPRPTAPNKMYNTELVERRSPGVQVEPVAYPKDVADLESNTKLLLPLVDAAVERGEFVHGTDAARDRFPARHGLVDHSTFVAMLGRHKWLYPHAFSADLRWLRRLTEHELRDWAVILPQHITGGRHASFSGHGPLSVFRRQRREERADVLGAISDPKHRPAANRIAGVETGAVDDPLTRSLHRRDRGALLLYPVVEAPADAHVEPERRAGEVILALVIVAPAALSAPGGELVHFQARDPKRSEEPIIDVR